MVYPKQMFRWMDHCYNFRWPWTLDEWISFGHTLTVITSHGGTIMLLAKNKYYFQNSIWDLGSEACQNKTVETFLNQTMHKVVEQQIVESLWMRTRLGWLLVFSNWLNYHVSLRWTSKVASYERGKKCDRFGNPFGFLAIIKFVINLLARYVAMHVKINTKASQGQQSFRFNATGSAVDVICLTFLHCALSNCLIAFHRKCCRGRNKRERGAEH